MASKYGHVDKGSIRNIMVVVMKRTSRGVVLVDLKAANLYQGTVYVYYHWNATLVAKSSVIDVVIARINLQQVRSTYLQSRNISVPTVPDGTR